MQIQQNAVAAIKKAGGTVVYDLEWRNGGPIRTEIRGFPTGWVAIRFGCPTG